MPSVKNSARPVDEIVEAYDLMAVVEQAVDEIAADKAGAAGDEMAGHLRRRLRGDDVEKLGIGEGTAAPRRSLVLHFLNQLPALFPLQMGQPIGRRRRASFARSAALMSTCG